MSSRVQNLLVVLGLVALAALGYYLYSQNQLTTLKGGSPGSISTEAAIESADFLRKLNELEQIDLDAKIFGDPRYQSFRNNRQPVTPEGVGRPNPFIPVTGQ